MKRRSSSIWRSGFAFVTAIAVAVAGLFLAPAAIADTAAPAKPATISVSPTTSNNGQVTVSWSASAGAAYYQVFRYHGTGTPTADAVTYLANTTNNYYIDQVPNDGYYKYAVMAVDSDGDASEAKGWPQVTVNYLTNGSNVASDTTAPAKPTNLTATALGGRQVGLSWHAPEGASDLWRYLIYRQANNGPREMIGYVYVSSGARFFADTLMDDRLYTYDVVAQDLSGNAGPASDTAQITFDLVAPLVQITSPAAGTVYRSEGSLPVTFTVTETGSGYDPDDVVIAVYGSQLSSPVIDLSILPEGIHPVTVTVTDRAGNPGANQVNLVISDITPANTPLMLTPSGFTDSLELTIDWAAPAQAGVTAYHVYRIDADGQQRLVGSTPASTLSLTTTVPDEGLYRFFVVAQYGDSQGASSATAAIVVDQTDPEVTITSPEHGTSYAATDGSIPVTFSVSDDASGSQTGSIVMRLDGKLFTGTHIDPTLLKSGDHTFKVTVTDLAGNGASAIARFTVTGSTGGGGDDDDRDEDEDEDEDRDEDEDDDDRGRGRGRGNGAFMPDLTFDVSEELQEEIIETLSEMKNLQGFHHGHYKALMAKAKAGAWRSFVLHIYKHTPRHIPEAASELLEMLGADDLEIDPRRIPDSEIEGWVNGRSKGRGR